MKKGYLSPDTKVYSFEVESAGFAAGSVTPASIDYSSELQDINTGSSSSSPQVSQFDILDSPSNQMENPFD